MVFLWNDMCYGSFLGEALGLDVRDLRDSFGANS